MSNKHLSQHNTTNEQKRLIRPADHAQTESGLTPELSGVNIGSLPLHSTTRALRQANVQRMQQTQGNAYVQRFLANRETESTGQLTAKANTVPVQGSSFVQRNCACGKPISGNGECEECRKKQESGVQEGAPQLEQDSAGNNMSGFLNPAQRAAVQLKELVVNSPDDIYEKEADRVADTVMRETGDNGESVKTPPAITPLSIQRRAGAVGPEAVDLDLGSSQGRSMESHVQREMESKFGHHFDGVRIHDNSNADQLARSINARAFTLGNDVFFSQSQYSPDSSAGKHLLAHELTHVIQQGHAAPQSNGNTVQRQTDEDENKGQEAVDDNLGEVKGAGTEEADQKLEEFNSRMEDEAGGGIQRKVDPQLMHNGKPVKPGEKVTQPFFLETQITPDQLPKSFKSGLEDETLAQDGAMGIQRQISSVGSNSMIQREGCRPPRLESRGTFSQDLDRKNWRAYVVGFSTASATNSSLRVSVWARAGVYYGIWVSFGRVEFEANMNISCTSVGNKCEISADEVAGSVFNTQDSPASGAIGIGKEMRRDNTAVALTPHTGASVGANSSVGAGVGSASVGVSFPDASMSSTRSHGTFIWTCEQPTTQS